MAVKKKTLIIGGISGYNWDQIKLWINSLKQTTYDGEVALVATTINKETIDRLTLEGVRVSINGKHDGAGNYHAYSKGAPHVERFFHIWNYLNSLDPEEYSHVITTDVRDVVFQLNPFSVRPMKDLVDYRSGWNLHILTGTEGLRYEQEPWGAKNFSETFGPFFYDLYKDKTIKNVGVIGGSLVEVRELLLTLFQCSLNRPIPIVDQAVYNFLLGISAWSRITCLTRNDESWVCHAGTTEEAVKSGAGDLGRLVCSDPEAYVSYLKQYKDNQPIVSGGFLYNYQMEKVAIVHQYDRIPGLKESYEKLYGDK